MTSDGIKALKRMVKERTNIEESRNALFQLLRRNAIKPEEVMEFVEAYQEHKKLEQPVDMPQSIKCYIAISYANIQEAIRKGYTYCPMTRVSAYKSSYDDEIFEVDLPLTGYKLITAKKVDT